MIATVNIFFENSFFCAIKIPFNANSDGRWQIADCR